MPRVLDGGTGTELERLGVPMNSIAWSAEAVLTHPQVLQKVHESFVLAGAEMIIANAFSAARHNLAAAGLEDRYEDVNRGAVRLARQAAKARGSDCLVAGAISTTTFSGALDYSRLPSGEAAVAEYARQAAMQVEAGAELVILEMMRDVAQTSRALAGAARAGVPVWVGFSCFTRQDGAVCLLDTDIPLARALEELDLSRADAVGIMHTLVEHTPAALDVLQPRVKGATFAYPHAGRFEMPNWIFQDAATPGDFARQGLALLHRGVDSVGGCCGITPAHIAALVTALAAAGNR